MIEAHALTIQSFLGNGTKAVPRDVLRMIIEHGIRMVDFKFTDLPGTWQHLGVSVRQLDEDTFTEGLGYDGSSIRGFQEIHESDMVLLPDPSTAVIDPFHEQKTLSIICNVVDPITREPYTRDPRYVAQKAEAYLIQTGIADTAHFGPEAEFFIFDSVRYEQTVNRALYEVDSAEGFWNTAARTDGGAPNLGYKLRQKEGYFPTPPGDTLSDLRTRMVITMEDMGIDCEFHHHEVSSGGQAEIDMRFDTLLRMADNLQLYKYVVRNVAARAGKSVTFMPKPLFEENGSGMHVHQSLWMGDDNVMYDFNGYGQLSREALSYIGGLLKHAATLLAFCAPTTNSYRRLVPGYEAPVNLVYSQRNRSAAVRIPVYSASPKAKRLEFRPPDPSANPYLAFTAMLMAGLDGIQGRLDPGLPVDADLYELPEEELAEIATVPGSLSDAIDALEADHEFLLKGGVFTEDLIETWIDYKRKEEVDPVRLRPHPWEFALYYDV